MPHTNQEKMKEGRSELLLSEQCFDEGVPQRPEAGNQEGTGQCRGSDEFRSGGATEFKEMVTK